MKLASRAQRLDPAFDDPDHVLALIRGTRPYWPLARDAMRPAERRASGSTAGGMFVPPWFRRDFATHGEVRVPGAEALLDNPRYRDAAAEVFGGDVEVEPTTVYVNLMTPCSYPFVAHVDVPVFLGASRQNAPVWLLHQMRASGLFEAEQVNLATIVAWFWAGPGGAFHYWPTGPHGDAEIVSPPMNNLAVAADNEITYHGVSPVGTNGASSPTTLSTDAELAHDAAGTWSIHDRGEPAGTYPDDQIRITISWKAEVFSSASERVQRHDGSTDLTDDEIIGRFLRDLDARGLDAAEPSDLRNDESWIQRLTEAYPESPPPVTVAAGS